MRVPLATTLCFASAVALGQAAAPAGKQPANRPAVSAAESARVEAVGKLRFLVGDWSGTGWIMLGRENRAVFQQTESVRTAAGGTVLVIDGMGLNSEGTPVHQAFVVVSYDPSTSHYLWRAFTAANGEVGVEPTVGEKSLVWGFPTAGGNIRFTITMTPAGEWHEIGEFSHDGATWHPTMEMTLKRK